jgi:hypothetical protein
VDVPEELAQALKRFCLKYQVRTIPYSDVEPPEEFLFDGIIFEFSSVEFPEPRRYSCNNPDTLYQP